MIMKFRISGYERLLFRLLTSAATILLLSAARPALASCLPPPSGLVGWWPAEGNANDMAGANNGSLQGGASASAAGFVGSAFSLDGTHGYVSVPDSPSLRPASLTLEAWVKF